MSFLNSPPKTHNTFLLVGFYDLFKGTFTYITLAHNFDFHIPLKHGDQLFGTLLSLLRVIDHKHQIIGACDFKRLFRQMHSLGPNL